MRLSNVAVEQIFKNNDTGVVEIVEDNGEILTPSCMKEIIMEHFGVEPDANGQLNGTYNGKRFSVFFKNVSYLGIPHPIFKKRIQIGSSFKDVYYNNLKNGIETLLIGIYRYKGVLLFVDFEVGSYIKRKAHNSSAHVYTNDLRNGLNLGIFQKEDANKNRITVFTPERIDTYLESKLIKKLDLRLDFIAVLDDFFASVNKTWHGSDCYREMLDAKFNNALQPEWPGFYLEYRLKSFIKSAGKEDIIKYSQNKRKGDIDLDLFLPQLGCYGDLKAHSNDSTGIQGNDYETIMSQVKTSSVYYVICNHDTIKDSNCGYEVTKLWNTLLGKRDLMSYSSKMKNTVNLTSYYVLEINKYNMKYLSVFNQGHNSNGAPREPKISIKARDIGNFLIHEVNF